MTSAATTANAATSEHLNVPEFELIIRRLLTLVTVQIASVSQRFRAIALALWIGHAALRASNAFILKIADFHKNKPPFIHAKRPPSRSSARWCWMLRSPLLGREVGAVGPSLALAARILEHAGLRRVVLEARVVADVGELGCVGWAVSLFRDDDLGYAWFLAFFAAVHFVAVDERDHVGVLLDRARLAQVGQHRAAVLTRLDLPIELRQRDHRHLQLLGQRFQRA